MNRNISRLAVALICLAPSFARAADAPAKAPFPYLPGKAWHIMPGTHTDESGYFSLNEGLDGKLYVGTAAYGRNAYLIEFDPKTEKQRIVIDAHKFLGLPLTPTGYAAQAKFHTRNFTGPSGKIYVGTKQGYPTKEDQEKKVEYPGGYVFIYDPKTDTTENLGMPFPTQGVIDTVADESRGLVYAVTCEDQHWMVYDLKAKKWTEPDPALRLAFYSTTLVNPEGIALSISSEGKLTRYNPATGKVALADLVFPDGGKFDKSLMRGPLTWVDTADHRTAYLIAMSRPNLFRVDLTGEGDKPAKITDLGPMIAGKGHDSRCGLTIAPDGRVYAIIKIDNSTGFGGGHLHHIVRYDPKKPDAPGTPGAAPGMIDLGVITVQNPDFFGRPIKTGGVTDDNGKGIPWTHGYHTLPDGVLTPLHAHMSLLATREGDLYVTILYPFTLLRIDKATLPK